MFSTIMTPLLNNAMLETLGMHYKQLGYCCSLVFEHLSDEQIKSKFISASVKGDESKEIRPFYTKIKLS